MARKQSSEERHRSRFVEFPKPFDLLVYKSALRVVTGEIILQLRLREPGGPYADRPMRSLIEWKSCNTHYLRHLVPAIAEAIGAYQSCPNRLTITVCRTVFGDATELLGRIENAL